MNELLDSGQPSLYEVITAGPGPQGKLPLTDDLLRNQPSGHAFGMSQDVGMGWTASAVAGPQYVLLSTLGGVRADNGEPIALGYHTGHWELVLALKAAAEEIKKAGGIPYAGHCTDPCDGRTQGTSGMFDSLAYRNDAASVLRRLARSIPKAQGVLGVATCDKGLPAMMMALAGLRDIPAVLIPGGVMLPVSEGEDTAEIQSIGVRYANGEITLEEAALRSCHSLRVGRRRLPFPGNGRHGAGRGRSPRAGVAPLRAGALRTTDLAGHGPPQRQSPDGLAAAGPENPRHPHGGIGPQCHDGLCRVRRIDQPRAPSAGHRLLRCRCRVRPWRIGLRSTAACRAWSPCCPMGRSTTRRCGSTWRAACPKSCSICGTWACWNWTP